MRLNSQEWKVNSTQIIVLDVKIVTASIYPSSFFILHSSTVLNLVELRLIVSKVDQSALCSDLGHRNVIVPSLSLIRRQCIVRRFHSLLAPRGKPLPSMRSRRQTQRAVLQLRPRTNQLLPRIKMPCPLHNHLSSSMINSFPTT